MPAALVLVVATLDGRLLTCAEVYPALESKLAVVGVVVFEAVVVAVPVVVPLLVEAEDVPTETVAEAALEGNPLLAWAVVIEPRLVAMTKGRYCAAVKSWSVVLMAQRRSLPLIKPFGWLTLIVWMAAASCVSDRLLAVS